MKQVFELKPCSCCRRYFLETELLAGRLCKDCFVTGATQLWF